MNNINIIIDKLMDHFHVINLYQLAEKLNMKPSSISSWKSKNTINPIKKKCKELGIYDEIFKDNNEEKITNNQNNHTYQLFDILYQSHVNNNTLSQLEESLTQQIVLETIQPIFRDMYAEKNFFKYLLDGHSNKTTNLLLLNRVLVNYQKDEVTLKNAKETLIKLIDQYNEMDDFKKIAIGRKKTDIKNTLIDFINNKIDNLAAYTILTNIPNVLKVLKENLTMVTKLHFVNK